MMSESKEKILDLRSVFGLQATVTTPARPPAASTSRWASRRAGQ